MMKDNLKTGILFGIAVLGTIASLTLAGVGITEYIIDKKNVKKEEKTYIEMDAVVTYSCKDYSVFSTAEFSNFVVFEEPERDFYTPVVLTIDIKNTSNTSDDEVVKVKDRDPDVTNSTGGDIYEY